MGDGSSTLVGGQPEIGISHRRLLIEMAVLTMVGAVVGFAVAGPSFGLGVVLGGLLAFLNYFWLKHFTAVIFEKALAGEQARLLPLRFISRYVVMGLVLFVIYLMDILPMTAVILGLAAFAVAVVFDGIVSIFRRTT